MFRTIGHTFTLMQASWRVFMKDRELILFPIMAGLSLAALLGIFSAIGSGAGTFDRLSAEEDLESVDIVLGALLVFLGYFVVIFFNAALIAAALERLRGGDPNVGSGLSAAASHIHTIIGWAIIAAAVALIFALLRTRGRNSFVTQIFAGLLETGWQMLTFFVVPILVAEGVGLFRAMKRSGELFRATWGRQLTASFGFGILYIGAIVIVGVVAGVLAAITPLLGIVVGVALLVLALGTVQAIEGIFKAALYEYARGEKPLEFPEADLRGAYYRKYEPSV